MNTDSDTYQMIQKLHKLQREIVAKTIEVDKKQKLIEEQEELYIQLGRKLNRQPDSEAAEQLSAYEKELRLDN